jgi:hypothetical protein
MMHEALKLRGTKMNVSSVYTDFSAGFSAGAKIVIPVLAVSAFSFFVLSTVYHIGLYKDNIDSIRTNITHIDERLDRVEAAMVKTEAAVDHLGAAVASLQESTAALGKSTAEQAALVARLEGALREKGPTK